MKLKDCKLGELVVTNNDDSNRILGHIVGLDYNINVSYTGGYDRQEKMDKIIPLVKWADGTTSGIHYAHINIYKG